LKINISTLGSKDKFRNFGCGLLGFSILAAVILLPFIILWGIAKVSEFLYPVFSALASASVLLFVAVVLPFSLIHKWRPFLANFSSVLSKVYGATVWMYSVLVIVGYLGWVAIFFVFLFHFVAPIAAIGLFLKGQSAGGVYIIIGLLFTYSMRFYAFWLKNLHKKQEDKGVFIDAESEVVE
jgi:hypothetical protein